MSRRYLGNALGYRFIWPNMFVCRLTMHHQFSDLVVNVSDLQLHNPLRYCSETVLGILYHGTSHGVMSMHLSSLAMREFQTLCDTHWLPYDQFILHHPKAKYAYTLIQQKHPDAKF